MTQAIGQYFDDPDLLFNWLHQLTIGVSALNFASESLLAERVAAGPVAMRVLAEEIGVPEDKLARIVDYLCAHDLLALQDGHMVAATARTAMIARYSGLWAQAINTLSAGARLLPALQQGKTPFELQFGAGVFEYFAAHPDVGARFGNFMGFMTGRVTSFLHASHRFEPFDLVVDIGGSHGGLLLSVLEQYPGTRGILFDLPEVADRERPQLEASAFADRVEVVGGSFFTAVPDADLYLLQQILHDWDDEECVRILATIRRAIRGGGRLAVIDHVLAEEPQPDEGQSTDIAMMIWDTGRERRQSEFEALFAAAGFRFDRVTRNPAGHSVIEAVPV